MLQTYEATYNGEQFRWINQAPPKLDKEVPVVLVMDVEKTAIKPKKISTTFYNALVVHGVKEKHWMKLMRKLMKHVYNMKR